MALRIHPDRDGHEHHLMGTGDSSCFYDPPVDITDWCRSLLEQGKRIEVRTARIEVTDQDGLLHAHNGYSFGNAAFGSGSIRSNQGREGLVAGDRFNFGPGDAHLSIADPGRTLIEMITYIGEVGDRQELVDVT
ncbi:MAG: hypothetical protein AB199_00580 [Parcubacteria bacterium C7867-004]|nr:MAG: hypothetical protein AB199_00580 [Parcubacteria bacterium C7867-004]